MEKSSHNTVTILLQQWQNGNQTALDDLLPMVYDELYRLASHYFQRESKGHTLQTTAIINEALIRLIEDQANFVDRSHFIAIMANVMRRVLVDHARKKKAQKRDAGFQVTLTGASGEVMFQDIDLIALNDALNKLAVIDNTQVQIVELRYFCGFTIEETATILGISQTTVKAEWSMARTWLYRELT
jgi:RNA polymerase sigma factor (TIGR02999 family)